MLKHLYLERTICNPEMLFSNIGWNQSQQSFLHWYFPFSIHTFKFSCASSFYSFVRACSCQKVSNTSADKEQAVKGLRFFSCRPNSFFDFTIVLDFALKCYQCHGSDAYCHQNKLKRNQTSDACNRYHNKCITKSFEFEAGVKEVTRGCGNEVECRVSAESCKRKAYPRYRCQISCCDEDYCNSGNLLGGMLCDSVLLLGSVFLSLTMHFHWTYL